MTGAGFDPKQPNNQGEMFYDRPACDTSVAYCEESAATLGLLFSKKPIGLQPQSRNDYVVWRTMDSAPKTTEHIMTKDKNGNVYKDVHFAEDLSGEEQPPFRGWFVSSGPKSYDQVPNPVAWAKMSDANKT